MIRSVRRWRGSRAAERLSSTRRPAHPRPRRLALEPLEQRALLEVVGLLPSQSPPGDQHGDLGGILASSQQPGARLDLTLVRQPTALEDPTTGEVEALPESLSWIDEWDAFFAEIWASTPGADDLGIASASVDLLYDTGCFTAASIEYGPAFTETPSGSTDEAAGRIEDLGGATLLPDVGDDKYALLARVALQPTESDPGVPNNAEAYYVEQVFTPWLGLDGAAVELLGVGPVATEFDDLTGTDLWPVIYDVDDDAQVLFGDLAYFATAFQQNVWDPGAHFAWGCDFDRSGRVDVGDLAFFAENFQRTRTDGIPRVYPSWIDGEWELPPNPANAAPPVEPGVATDFASATEFLYTASHPIQTGVEPDTIEANRVAVLRGKVLHRDGSPLRGVTITMLDHPEFGQTLSRADGMFDLAVNGGGYLTVVYERDGYLPAQRQVEAPCQDYQWLPDVVVIPLDAVVTTIDLTSSEPMQVARGSVMTDLDGARQATILFPQGTQAEMVMPDGSTQPLTTLNVRATEYTVGESGVKAMPAELPPTSGYTYCVEVTADEALAAGAADVRFGSPVYYYVEDFIGFPVGSAVPSGYYDRQAGQWIASANGRVIEVVGVTGGLADLDTDGDGAADDPATLALVNVADAERERLAELYQPGQTVWRVPMTHFTPWDCNWPYGPPPDALPPNQPPPHQIKPEDEFCAEAGSIIECQNQILGERIPVTGTSFTLNYRSDRVPGSRAPYHLDIPLSGSSVPSGLKRIKLLVSVAGHEYRERFDPLPNLTASFDWDGKDDYGRTVQGQQEAHVLIFYVYDAYYYAVEGQFENAFARIRGAAGAGGFTGVILPARASLEVEVLQYFEVSVGCQRAPLQELGGWTLEPHHAYDPGGHVLYLGDGSRRSATGLHCDVVHTVAGTDTWGYNGDDIPATDARLYFPRGVAVGPDGTFYIADERNDRVRRVASDGIITTVAGFGPKGYSGDGGPATEAQLDFPNGVAVATDGCLYIADSYNDRIRRVGPDGIITTVAGSSEQGYSGDGGPATEAQLCCPMGIAVSPDGSLYIADTFNECIRRVGPDGIISTVAGTGSPGNSGDGGLATEAKLTQPSDVAVGPDGSLYIADRASNVIRRVGPDGIITTVAGTGLGGFSGDGGPATEAQLLWPSGVAVDTDGSFYIADSWHRRIRRVDSSGTITTVVGNGATGSALFDIGDGKPATQFPLWEPCKVALGADGSLYISDVSHGRVFQLSGAYPGFAALDIPIPSEDGGELYHFDPNGRHLRTLDALTGAVLHQFTYDEAGRLAAVEDGDGNLTTIERDADGKPTAIVAPFGQRTALTLDANGYLAGITNPAGETTHFTYTDGGLLPQTTDPRGYSSHYTYDDLGLLIKAEDAGGGYRELSRSTTENGYQVTVTTAMGRASTYCVERLPTGEKRMVNSFPGAGCLSQETLIGTDGTRQTTYACGTVVTQELAPDPRWGMLAPETSSLTVVTPSGLTFSASVDRVAELDDPADLMSLRRLTTVTTINGKEHLSVYDALAHTLTTTTPEGRQTVATLDARGRITQVQDAGFLPFVFTYDAAGRVTAVTQGTGDDARTLTFDYNAEGYEQRVTDPLGQSLEYTYDAAGRLESTTSPDGQVSFSYDAAGNLVSIAPSDRPDHQFAYDLLNQLAEYGPPNVGLSENRTLYSYNEDRQVTCVTRPDGQTIEYAYDAAGRLISLTTPSGVTTYQYDADTGQLATITTPQGVTSSFAYNGDLLVGETWSGPVSGSITYTQDQHFFTSSSQVNGGDTIEFASDNDDRVVQAGDLTFTRDGQSGFLTGSQLGNLTTAIGYNDFGELAEYTAQFGDTDVFSFQLTRDKLGRVSQKTETVSGVTRTYTYTYDELSRLIEVSDGAQSTTYSYDANGNRLSRTTSAGTEEAVYDDQDRLLQYGSTSYAYTANGELLSKTADGQTTTYDYDVQGNLISATLPDGRTVEYLIDGRGNRVGKKIDGTLVQGFLYKDCMPLAELDASGNVVSRFVYSLGEIVPEFMVKDGATYRIITDHLGSPRLVVDVDTGQITQQIDYDEFGNVTLDTNPGFQPFGFAGGIYDADTRLTRFWARDYDAATGRWTAKDPIGFAGGDLNLYAYALNDPINLTDPVGLECRGRLKLDKGHVDIQYNPCAPVSERKPFTKYRYREGSGWSSSEETPIVPGDVITTAKKSRVTVVFSDGSVLRLGSGKRVEITQELCGATTSAPIGLKLKGGIYGVIHGLFGSPEFEVETSNAVAGVRG